MFDENSGREITIFVTSSFSKSSVFKLLSVLTNRKAGVFKFLRFEERFRKAPFSRRISVDGRSNHRNKAPFLRRISVDGRSNRRNKAAFSWRISVDGRPNRRNKAPFLRRISVDGRSNRRNKAAFSWRISVDGRPNRRNKAPFLRRISVDGRPNRRNKAALSVNGALYEVCQRTQNGWQCNKHYRVNKETKQIKEILMILIFTPLKAKICFLFQRLCC